MADNAASSEAMSASTRKQSERPWWFSMLVNLLLALIVVSLVQAFVVRVHNVASGSMEQTLRVNDRVLSSPLPYRFGEPQRGDIIIFGHGETWGSSRRAPASNPIKAVARTFGDLTGIGTSNTNYTVKRVIGLPGDTVSCCDAQGRVLVNGESLDEPYIYQDVSFDATTQSCSTAPASARCFAPITVPPGRYLVMGDHRSNSADSVMACRSAAASADCAIFVTREQITGKVFFRLWPVGSIN